MNLTSCDIENLVLLTFLALLFLFSLRKRDTPILSKRVLVIDRDMSLVLKGIACVLVLMGHYVNFTSSFVPQGYFSKAVYATTANIGLAWFMFFSGYGLSLKNIKNGEYVKRLSKVFLPLFFVCSVTVILYSVWPNTLLSDEMQFYGASNSIIGVKSGDVWAILRCVFGWLDWYVYCIMIFYTMYYASAYLSTKWDLNQTILLCSLFVCYFICAYIIFGPAEAHWYRYIWTFLLGHIVAKQNILSKYFSLIVFLPFLLLTLLEGKTMILSYVIAVIALLIISKLEEKYYIKSKSPLLFLGSVSYFYYLVHGRISWQILAHTKMYSLLIWAVLSLLVAFLLKVGYDKISMKKK